MTEIKCNFKRLGKDIWRTVYCDEENKLFCIISKWECDGEDCILQRILKQSHTHPSADEILNHAAKAADKEIYEAFTETAKPREKKQ